MTFANASGLAPLSHSRTHIARVVSSNPLGKRKDIFTHFTQEEYGKEVGEEEQEKIVEGLLETGMRRRQREEGGGKVV